MLTPYFKPGMGKARLNWSGSPGDDSFLRNSRGWNRNAEVCNDFEGSFPLFLEKMGLSVF
jgi:hypothetical protein